MSPKKPTPLLQKINKNNQNTSGKKIIVACSGGPDSMVLLDLYAKGILPSSGIIVTHINHHLRETAKRDEKIVETYCIKNQLPFEVFQVDIKKEAKKTKTTLEECARNIRKKWLEKIRKKHHADTIVTAHHTDDQAETLLYRIVKGTSITGLVGIEENTKYYFRPLIHSKKSEILEYAKQNQISFGHDETNDDTSIPRNLLRHEVIPKLQKINPEVNLALSRLSQSAEELKSGFDIFFTDVLKNESFSFDWYHSLPLGFQHEFLRCIYEQHNGSTHGLSRALILEIDRFFSTRNGGKKEFGNIWLAKKSGTVYLTKI